MDCQQAVTMTPERGASLRTNAERVAERRGEQLEVPREVTFVGLEQIDPRSIEKLVLRHRRLGQHQEPVGIDAPSA